MKVVRILSCIAIVTGLVSCEKSKNGRVSNSSGSEHSTAEILRFVGEGYDRFTGSPKENCLFLDAKDVEVTPLRQTESTLDIVDKKTELMRKVAKSNSIGLGVSYSIFNFGVSRSTATVNEIEMKTRDFVAVTELVYRDRVLRLKPQDPSLKSKPTETLEENGDLFGFRDQCGDMYVKEAVYGSRMLLFVKASSNYSNEYSSREVSNALNFGISSLFGFGVNGSVGNSNAQENRDILSTLNFEAYCVTEGAAPASICGNYNIDFSNDALMAEVSAQFREAREKFASSVVNAEDKHVRLDIDFGDYTAAKALEAKSGSEFEERVNKVNSMFELSEEMKAECADLSFGSKDCGEAIEDINNTIYSCSKQSEWTANCPNVPDEQTLRTKYAEVLDLRNAGTVKLFEETDFQGTPIEINYSNLFTEYAEYNLDQNYFLGSDRYQFNDRLSSIEVNLKPKWELILYEDIDRGGRVIRLTGNTKGNISELGDGILENEVSEFELRRTED